VKKKLSPDELKDYEEFEEMIKGKEEFNTTQNTQQEVFLCRVDPCSFKFLVLSNIS